MSKQLLDTFTAKPFSKEPVFQVRTTYSEPCFNKWLE